MQISSVRLLDIAKKIRVVATWMGAKIEPAIKVHGGFTVTMTAIFTLLPSNAGWQSREGVEHIAAWIITAVTVFIGVRCVVAVGRWGVGRLRARASAPAQSAILLTQSNLEPPDRQFSDPPSILVTVAPKKDSSSRVTVEAKIEIDPSILGLTINIGANAKRRYSGNPGKAKAVG